MNFDRMIVLDFETTGLLPGYRPVEIAWVEFDADFNELDSVSSLINPYIEIEPGAQRVHGISAEMLIGKPSLDDFMKVTRAGKFEDEHVLVVAHNASFDVPMFAPYCKQLTPLCTMQLGQSFYPESSDYKLQTLSTLLNLEDEPTHRALADASTCFHLMKQIATTHNMGIGDLLSVIDNFSLESTMPFGKHKGTKLKDLPSDYAEWLTTNLDADNWVRQALLGG